MICNYENCQEEVFKGRYCILHTELPEDENSLEFLEINELKEEKVKCKINNNDFNFAGAKLYGFGFNLEPPFHKYKINDDLNFVNAEIKTDLNLFFVKFGHANFSNITVGGNTYLISIKADNIHFNEATFKKNVEINGEITGYLIFKNSAVNGTFRIEGKIGRSLKSPMYIKGKSLINASIGKDLDFNSCYIKDLIDLSKTIVKNNTDFSEAEIHGMAYFHSTIMKGSVTFVNTKFFGDNNIFTMSFIGSGIFSGQRKFDAFFENAILKNVIFRDCDLTNVRFNHAILENCDLSTSTWAVYKLPEHRNNEENAKVLVNTYRKIRHSLQQQGEYDKAGKFYIEEMNMKKQIFKEENNWGSWIFYNLLYYMTGYGEKLRYIFLIFIVTWLIYIYSILTMPSNNLILPIGSGVLSIITSLLVYVFARKMTR